MYVFAQVGTCIGSSAHTTRMLGFSPFEARSHSSVVKSVCRLPAPSRRRGDHILEVRQSANGCRSVQHKSLHFLLLARTQIRPFMLFSWEADQKAFAAVLCDLDSNDVIRCVDEILV